jgi:hypothetical protein
MVNKTYTRLEGTKVQYSAPVTIDVAVLREKIKELKGGVRQCNEEIDRQVAKKKGYQDDIAELRLQIDAIVADVPELSTELPVE